MKFNGTNTESWGLLVSKTTGFFDMPDRVSPVIYDWGDTLQPLLDEEDIFWKSLSITVEFVYDSRITGNTYEQTMTALKALDEFEIEQTFASGGNGVFTVRVQSSQKEQTFGPLTKATVVLYNRVPTFTGTLPSANDSSSSIGGYSFSQFGLVVSSKLNFRGLGELKQSKETTYMSDTKKSAVRGLNQLSIDCWIVGSNTADLIKKVAEFKKLLSLPDAKVLKYAGKTKNVFLSNGFKVEVHGKRAAKFNLKLNEIE